MSATRQKHVRDKSELSAMSAHKEEVEEEVEVSKELRSCAEPSRTRDSAPPVMIFACAGRQKEWPLTQDRIDGWQQTFPALDVPQCCREARQWCFDNAAKRKTASGMPAFLGRWMSKAQNGRGGAIPIPGHAGHAAYGHNGNGHHHKPTLSPELAKALAGCRRPPRRRARESGVRSGGAESREPAA
jgi:hypothetical protein